MTCTGCTNWPSAAAMGSMNEGWSKVSVSQTGTLGTIGMWGDNDTSNYNFYMYFQANNDDAWWSGASTTKNFTILFQMGSDSSSVWTGVKYINTADITSA